MKGKSAAPKGLCIVAIVALLILGAFGGSFGLKKTPDELSIDLRTEGAAKLIKVLKDNMVSE